MGLIPDTDRIKLRPSKIRNHRSGILSKGLRIIWPASAAVFDNSKKADSCFFLPLALSIAFTAIDILVVSYVASAVVLNLKQIMLSFTEMYLVSAATLAYAKMKK